MDEYRQTYAVNRRMHMRPLSEVVENTIDLVKEYKELEVLVRNPSGLGSMPVSAWQLLGMMTNRIGSHRTVEIIVRGTYDLSILQAAADKVGAAFEKNIEEYPLSDFDLNL